MNMEEFIAWVDSPEYKKRVADERKAKEDAEDEYYFRLGEIIESNPRYLKLKAFW